jgi:cysteine desulfurase
MAMDLAGVAVSAGSACSSGKVKKSHVLEAMNMRNDIAQGAIRVSFGWNSGENDYMSVAQAWIDVARRKGVLNESACEERA